MSSKNKQKKPNDTESDSYDSDSSGDDSEAYNGNEVIQVDFEGRSPMTSDFHGIRQMLQQLFLKSDINLSELADIITGQSFIGSVVIQSFVDEDSDDDDDENGGDAEMDASDTIFGITTAINISKSHSHGCIDSIRQHVLAKCAAATDAGDAKRQLFASVLNDDAHQTGLLINERFINIPAQIAGPLLESLASEIDAAARTKEQFRFTHFVAVVKFNRKVGKGSKKGQIEDILTNDEEEILEEFADASFEYSAAGETDSTMAGNWTESDATLVPHRKVVLFEAAKLPRLIDAIKQLISE